MKFELIVIILLYLIGAMVFAGLCDKLSKFNAYQTKCELSIKLRSHLQ